jgi:hypothetical protein
VSNACKKKYRYYPNVIAIGVGLKFINGNSISNSLCIQFYVTEKIKEITANKRLPRFVYGRTSDGEIDRSTRIPTDIIELKGLHLACKSGTEIGVIGEEGTITLIFRNKELGSSDFYLITCAHVAGDVLKSEPIDPTITSSCCNKSPILASTVVNSTQKDGRVKYDIALAKIAKECTPQSELEVTGSSTIIDRFLPSDEIRVGMQVSCAFPKSNLVSAQISSSRISLPIIIDGREYQVDNLFKIDKPVREGDSGGLLYDGSDAIGILVAKSDGFGFFQPIEEAFEHLKQITTIPIKCF